MSAPDLLDTNSTTRKWSIKRGAAIYKKCPKEGTIWLRTRTGYDCAFLVTCKSWHCMGCRDRKLNQVKGLIACGLLAPGRFYLITLTYVAVWSRDGILENPVDAKTASKHFRKLLVLMKSRMEEQALVWLKVPELTKRKQLHWHLVMGGLSKKYRRCKTVYKRWRGSCQCLEHQISKLWLDITGDSHVVDVRVVIGAIGAASYLAKYLGKQIVEGSVRDELEKRGYIRRYSRSRNWRGGYKMQRRGTVEDSWFVVGHMKGRWFDRIRVLTHYTPEAEQVGDPYAVQLSKAYAVLKAIRMKNGDTNLNGQIRDEVERSSSRRSGIRVANPLGV